MTAAEIATLPEARLGGSLLWVVIGACILPILLTVPFILLSTLYANMKNDPGHATALAIAGVLHVLPRYLPVFFLMVWAAVFAVMTWRRSARTPMVACAGLVLWVVLRLVVELSFEIMEMSEPVRGGLSPYRVLSLWGLAYAIGSGVILVAAFCGYMATGRRPNAYYRHRLPTS